MDAHEIEVFQQKLLALQEELKQLDAKSKDATQPVQLDQTSVGRLSRMDSIQGQQMALELKRRRQTQITRISAALKRIKDGRFGLCLKCKKPISHDRLDFDPTATLCVHCADL